MQKIVRFLESSVEWVVLGIAVLFLGWAAFYYLISDPVSKTLDGSSVNPGNVDQFIADHAAKRLGDKINDVEAVPSFNVENFTLALDQKLSLDDDKPTELASGDFDYSPFDIGNLPGQANTLGVPVQVLPTLPAAQPLLIAAALDTLAPNANGAAPNAAAPNGAQPAIAGKDTRLVVAAFTIPWSDLYNQWNKSFGPPQPGGQPRLSPADFQILAITAYRDEKIGTQWSKGTVVKAFISDLPKYPIAGDKLGEQNYLQALAKEANSVVAPTIPTPLAGVVWKDPLMYLPSPSGQAGNPSPTEQNGSGMLPATEQPMVINTSESLGGTLLAQYRGGGGGAPGGFGGGPRFGGPPRPQAPPQNTEQTPPPAPPTPIAPAPGTVDPVVVQSKPNVVPDPMPIEAAKQLNVVAMPAKGPDLCVYIVDDTADAGKTYRYRIVYKALNPLFNKAPEHASKAQWVNQFDLVSPMSDFSPEITVPVQTYFFCGKQQGVNKTSACPFDVFTWSNGKWQQKTFNANVGDPIGGMDGTVDYFTGYSFVEKISTRKTLVTLVDRDGIADIRDATKDYESADYKQKAQWVEQDKNGGTQNLAQPGGMPPGGFGGGPPGFGGGPPGGQPGYGGPPGYGGAPGRGR